MVKVGTTVFFTYDDMEYERDIEEVVVYKNYSWFGSLGFGFDVAFAIHGDLNEKNEPVMEGLAIQVDGLNSNIHEYIREGITFENNL